MMTFKFDKGALAVRRNGGPKIYSESAFWYQLKQALNKAGHDVIKKLMWKDGHLTSEDRYYVRSRRLGPDSIMVYDDNYAIRPVYEDYNRDGGVVLSVSPGVEEGGRRGRKRTYAVSRRKTRKESRGVPEVGTSR